MPSGILIINKPQDWTSMDVCAKLRGVFYEKRVGHAGTLDPMATGVLPVFLGRATRAIQFAETGEKEYLAGLRLGLTTNTQDSSGEVLERHPSTADFEQVHAALLPFHGEIRQVPPMYSAIKIGGKKLYELARKGIEVERPARAVTIYSLNLLDELSPEGDFQLRVRCSKGTYIRTLCHDIGQALGCGGVMSSLVRTEACGFSLEQDALSLAEVVNASDPTAFLRPLDRLFQNRPTLTVNANGEERLRHGAGLSMKNVPDGTYRVYGPQGDFLLLGSLSSGTLSSIKNFFEV